MPFPTPHPIKTGSASARRVKPTTRLAGWRRRVLIVEDDAELHPIFERYTARVDPGLSVEVVATSDEAIERLASGVEYHAVVTDYCLPRPRDGRRVQRSAAKLQPATRLGTVSALMNYKRDDRPFLAKPFSLLEYREFLRELLG